MSKIKKLYTRAIDKYENGYIDDAIDICEDIMSLNMKYKPAINLKGLLYYFKGDIENSKILWKLNSQVNNDKVSKKYLQGINEDEKIFSTYVKAIEFMNKNKINNALDLLMKCKVTDYNRINVDNNISTCYIKLGEYNKAVEYLNRVLEIDIKNSLANENKKKLMKKNIDKKFIKSKNNKNKVIVTSIIILIITISILKGKSIVSKVKNIANSNNKLENSINKKDNYIENTKVYKKNEIKEQFSKEKFNQSVNNKNFNEIYNILNAWKGKKLDVNNRTLLCKGEEILKDEGVKYFYNVGRECVDANNKWEDAIDNLTKAYEYGKGSYLYGHILFMLGVSYQNKQDVKNALKYYIEYEGKYPNENYIQEVLYRTTILYKNIDLNKAKEYGQKLLTKYPDCEYANSKIRDIVSR